MSKRGTIILLITGACLGLAQLPFAIADPPHPGPWLGALAMALLVFGQFKRLRELSEDNRDDQRTSKSRD